MNKWQSFLIAAACVSLPLSGSGADIKLFDAQSVFGTFSPNDYEQRKTFDLFSDDQHEYEGVKQLVLTCLPGNTAKIYTPYDASSTGVIVDNFMTINVTDETDPVNLCLYGESPSSNCFSSGVTNGIGNDITTTHTGIGEINIPVGDGQDDLIKLGTNSYTFGLWDWGAVAGRNSG